MLPVVKKIAHLTYSRTSVVIANLIVLILASRYLSLHDYATFRQTFLPYEIMAPILALGLPQTVYFFLPRRPDKVRLIVQSILLMSIPSMVFGGFIVFFGVDLLPKLFNNPSLSNSIIWLIPYSFFQLLIALLVSIFVYDGKTKFIGLFSSISALIFMLCTVMLIMQNSGYIQLVLLKTFISVITASVLLLYALKFFYESNVVRQPIIKSSANLLKMSIPFGMASMIGAVSLQVDKLLVSTFGTPSDFAIYINGAMQIPLIGIITGSVSTVLIGELSKKIKEKEYDEALYLFRQTANKTALLLFPLMIFFMFNAQNFMILLYSDKFILSAIPFTIYLFLIPIRIVIFGSIFIAMGDGRIILYRSIIEIILNIILSIVLYNIFGYLGVAMATVLVTYIWSVPFNIKYLSKKFSINCFDLFDLGMLAKTMLISVIAIPVMLIVKYKSIVFINILLSFILYAFLIVSIYQYLHFIKIPLLNRKSASDVR